MLTFFRLSKKRYRATRKHNYADGKTPEESETEPDKMDKTNQNSQRDNS